MPLAVKRETLHIPESWLWIGGGAAVVLLFGPAIARALVRQTVSAAYNIPVEAVIGAGEAIGIPPTDLTLCDQYKAADDAWNASFYCPAANFLKWYWWDRPSYEQRVATMMVQQQPVTSPAVVVPSVDTTTVPDISVPGGGAIIL